MSRTTTPTQHFPIQPLSSVVEFLDHLRRPVKAGDRPSGSYPYFGANGQQGTIDEYLFDEPLVLLAEDGGHFESPERGIAYRISGKTWVNNHAHVLRPRENMDSGFLCRILENRDVTRFITGTTRAKLTKMGASQIPIPVPPVDVQHQIAHLLDSVDALRTKRREAISFLDELTKSIFFEMFGNVVRNDRGWNESQTLGEVAHVTSGITKGRKMSAEPTRAVPFMAVLNVQERHLNLSVVKDIEATEAEIERYQLLKDDLLLTEGGDPDKLGRGTLWRNELPECIHQNHIFRVRLERNSAIEPVFLNWLVASERGRRFFLRSAKQTTGIASINSTQLKQFPLLIPPAELQRSFAQRIDKLEQHKASNATHLSELDALFASIRHRAFRGELWDEPVI
ncbi:restriction endonuclease subunit S [Solihabitans fulvus]|uniref:Restriction endonuclease subunit S n=1 Tax=Solihabitans fulvus TaxID=1892852 RepID=A0A5B2XVV8_9PSEU|nr:restriction endonuclease subunit S [Solihabitans fulvus]KAA2266999.1 restriction endonuclease subunit S [Solihabitans fulvus]